MTGFEGVRGREEERVESWIDRPMKSDKAYFITGVCVFLCHQCDNKWGVVTLYDLYTKQHTMKHTCTHTRTRAHTHNSDNFISYLADVMSPLVCV